MIHYTNSTNHIINLNIKVIAAKHFLITRLASQIELLKFVQRTGRTAYSLAVRYRDSTSPAEPSVYLSVDDTCLLLGTRKYHI